MNNTTKIMLTTLVGVGMIAGVGTANAQTGTTTATTTATTTPSKVTPLITALSQRFNLSITDLQSFFASYKAQHDAKKIARVASTTEARISKAVTNGKLTQAQADLLKAEMAKVKIQLEALKGKTEDEQKIALKNLIAAEKAWAQANNIPFGFLESALKVSKIKGKGHGRGGFDD